MKVNISATLNLNYSAYICLLGGDIGERGEEPLDGAEDNDERWANWAIPADTGESDEALSDMMRFNFASMSLESVDDVSTLSRLLELMLASYTRASVWDLSKVPDGIWPKSYDL